MNENPFINGTEDKNYLVRRLLKKEKLKVEFNKFLLSHSIYEMIPENMKVTLC